MDPLALKVARRFVAERLTKDWLMAVRRGWLKAMKPTIHDYKDVLQAITTLERFAENLRDQVFNVRRGPLTSLHSQEEYQKLDAAFKKLIHEIRDTGWSRAKHWQECYEGKALSDCRADGEKMLDLYRTNFESATSSYKPARGGLGLSREAGLTEFFDDVLKLLYADAKLIREHYDREEQRQQREQERGHEPGPIDVLHTEETFFREFHLGRMRVVIADPQTHGHRIREYVKFADKAHQLIEKKGFGKAWYGTMILKSSDFQKLTPYEQAQYERAGYKNLESVAGLFHSGADIVELTAPSNERLVRTICHEIGHRWWFKFLSSTNRALFEDLLKRGVEPVSEYGKNNAVEAFAEVFAWYCTGLVLNADQEASFRRVISGSSLAFEASSEEPDRFPTWPR